MPYDRPECTDQARLKTTFEEKPDLAVIKQAVLKMLEDTHWAEIKNVGEDFSLWLHSLNRSFVGEDSVITRLIVELRTPAMLSNGTYIDSRMVTVGFNSNDMPMSHGAEMESFVGTQLASLGSLAKLTPLVATSFAPRSEVIIGAVIQGVMREPQRTPEPWELFKASLASCSRYGAFSLALFVPMADETVDPYESNTAVAVAAAVQSLSPRRGVPGARS